MVREDPGGGGGSFAGIDPTLMGRMNAAISSGAQVLVDQGGGLKNRLAGQLEGIVSEALAREPERIPASLARARRMDRYL